MIINLSNMAECRQMRKTPDWTLGREGLSIGDERCLINFVCGFWQIEWFKGTGPCGALIAFHGMAQKGSVTHLHGIAQMGVDLARIALCANQYFKLPRQFSMIEEGIIKTLHDLCDITATIIALKESINDTQSLINLPKKFSDNKLDQGFCQASREIVGVSLVNQVAQGALFLACLFCSASSMVVRFAKTASILSQRADKMGEWADKISVVATAVSMAASFVVNSYGLKPMAEAS